MKDKKLLIFPAAAFVLELLPWGAVLNFMRPPEEEGSVGAFRETFSYFSLTPAGYLNVGPLLTGILTVVLLILLLRYWAKGKESTLKRCEFITLAACVASLMPLLFGISFYSLIGAAITVLMVLTLIEIKKNIKEEKLPF